LSAWDEQLNGNNYCWKEWMEPGSGHVEKNKTKGEQQKSSS